MRKSIIRLLLLGMIAGSTACTNGYEGFNTDPNGTTEEEGQRDGYNIRGAMKNMQGWIIPLDVNANQFVECLMGGSFGGYLADSNSGFNGKNYASYNPEEHWIQVAFNDIISKTILNYNDLRVATDDPVLLAISDVLKVASISRVTDIYGPIPYSKLGKDGKLTAPYDSQKEVYAKMFEELDAAIDVLTENRTNDFSEKADMVFNGRVENWLKLANSLKLRLAMRIVNVDPTTAQTKAVEAATHTVGTMTSNADNAFITPTVTNPFRVVMYEYNNGDSRISADITSYMNGYQDPRRSAYFTVSTFENSAVNGYVGLRSGIQIPGGATVKQYSNMNVKTDSKVMWMNAAEVAFLKAEGALRGWNMGSPSVAATTPAEGFYKMGIQLSFDQWNASGAEQYMENSTFTPDIYKDPVNPVYSYDGKTSTITIKWNEGAGFETNLERIITQKWIANFPLGVEAWSEFRRTGYPKLMTVQVNNSGGKVLTDKMARRLPYPQTERDENKTNWDEAVNSLLKGPDTMGTDVWWAKK